MGIDHSSGEKPKKLYENLGLDVKLESKSLENDPWAQNTLKEIGKTMKPEGGVYMGSIALHYYRSSHNDIMGRREVMTVQQLAITDVNEHVVLQGVQNLAITLKNRYGRKHSTNDPRDKRDLTGKEEA